MSKTSYMKLQDNKEMVILEKKYDAKSSFPFIVMRIMGLPEETRTVPLLQSQIWAGISTGSSRTVQQRRYI